MNSNMSLLNNVTSIYSQEDNSKKKFSLKSLTFSQTLKGYLFIILL